LKAVFSQRNLAQHHSNQFLSNDNNSKVQRISVTIQRFMSVLLRDSFAIDGPDHH